LEKQQYGWKDKYGVEKSNYLTRIGRERREEDRQDWNRIEMERDVIEKERIKMRRKEEEKIKKARYNPRFKDIKAIKGCPRYLEERSLENTDKGEEIRALIKLRCGNYENANKYWLNEELGICVL